jgi:hypothetical protein
MPNGVFPVPTFRFEAREQTASPWLRLRVLTHRDSLDHELARGVDPNGSAALALRAEQLIRDRERLALRVEAVLETAATRPVFSAAAPVRRAQVLVCADDLTALARRLRDDLPVDVEGVAMTSVLLTHGTSPLYAGDRSLAHAVRTARLALDPIGESLALAA